MYHVLHCYVDSDRLGDVCVQVACHADADAYRLGFVVVAGAEYRRTDATVSDKWACGESRARASTGTRSEMCS